MTDNSPASTRSNTTDHALLRVTVAALRRVLGEAPGGIVDRLVRAGQITTDRRGRVDLGQAVPAFLTELRADLRGSTQTAASERARQARAEALGLRLAIERRELIQHDQAEAATDALCGAVLTALHGLPSRITRDMGTRRRIDSLVLDVQAALAADLRQAAGD